MNIVQSYLTSVMKGNFSLYETRLFCKIVERANNELRGKRVKDLKQFKSQFEGQRVRMSVAVRDVVAPGSNDYQKVFDAAKGLADKSIEFWDSDKGLWVSSEYKGKNGVTRYYFHLIEEVSEKNGSGKVNFYISVWLWHYILTFVNGAFSMYDLQVALSLPTAYSVRMYWLTSSATRPIPYPIQMLRDMLGVGDKYKSNKDFIKRCIADPARVLEERGLNGYTYKAIHKYENSKTSAIKSILIIPVKRQALTDSQISAQGPLSVYCSNELKQYLQTQCDFEEKSLYANKLTLADFEKIHDWRDIIVRIVHAARRKGASQGYIINAMKNEVAKHTTILQRAISRK